MEHSFSPTSVIENSLAPSQRVFVLFLCPRPSKSNTHQVDVKEKNKLEALRFSIMSREHCLRAQYALKIENEYLFISLMLLIFY